MAKKILTLVERFMSHVEPEPMSGCWLWTACVDREGYGQFKIGLTVDGSRRQCKAHRVAYELFRGRIQDGLIIDHLCRNPSCVNPDHMECVSNRINVLRGLGFTAENAKKTHCPNGHEYSGTNLRVRPNGQRRCAMCWADHCKRYYHKNRDAQRARRRAYTAAHKEDRQ